ncbi:unnamed protein product [Heterobilharzia americana]|nr:unnamed protein product [Heterobilharzia americana]
MECVIGIKMNDFVLLAADMRCAHSILTIKHDERKMYKFSNRVLAAVCGESGDTSQFSEYIQQNMQLYEIRNGYELTPSAAANFTRNNMAESLRSRSPYFVNMLIAGYDSQTGPELYFLDYLASLVKVPFAVHGYGSLVTLSILDRMHRPDMTVEEAVTLLRSCIQEVQKRLVINLDRYMVRIVTKDGIEELPDLTDFAVKV